MKKNVQFKSAQKRRTLINYTSLKSTFSALWR